MSPLCSPTVYFCRLTALSGAGPHLDSREEGGGGTFSSRAAFCLAIEHIFWRNAFENPLRMLFPLPLWGNPPGCGLGLFENPLKSEGGQQKKKTRFGVFFQRPKAKRGKTRREAGEAERRRKPGFARGFVFHKSKRENPLKGEVDLVKISSALSCLRTLLCGKGRKADAVKRELTKRGASARRCSLGFEGLFCFGGGVRDARSAQARATVASGEDRVARRAEKRASRCDKSPEQGLNLSRS